MWGMRQIRDVWQWAPDSWKIPMWKETLKLRAFSLFKIPLLFLVRPQIIEITKNRCEVMIPLNPLTRNHVKSMYFGVLAMGADLAGGTFVLDAIERSQKKVGFIFKDFTADFLKRAEGDVHFICKEGKKVYQVVDETIRTKKRANVTVDMYATVPKKTGDEPVAKFTLTISVKAS